MIRGPFEALETRPAMATEELDLDDELKDLLERVREQVGLDSLDQAAELLLRRRLRNGTRALTGRGRALHLVGGIKGDPKT